MKLHITVPAGNVGDVSSDLSGRRGQMVGMDSAGGGMTTVEATAPLAEVMTYARTLSSMTGGQGSFTMEFSHYDVVPGNVQQEIMRRRSSRTRKSRPHSTRRHRRLRFSLRHLKWRSNWPIARKNLHPRGLLLG